MKLLIITQAVDKNNPVLGFFHRWIEEFSNKFESILVICLEKGEYDLPLNVKVLSLGKEKIKSKFSYLWHFYKYIWQERKNYDAVFVHMNQEYVLLGWKIWYLLGKKIYMWRNHGIGSFLTDLATFFCTKVFCTSKFSYIAKYKKTVIMPVGIDTRTFAPIRGVERKKGSILYLGRIAPVKRPDLLIEALNQLKDTNWTLSIVGDALPKDELYYKSLKNRVLELGLDKKVNFIRGVVNTETPKIYSAHEIFINLSPSGMYDKTIFEAMMCGCVPLFSNKNLHGEIDDSLFFQEGDVSNLTNKIENLLTLPPHELEKLELNAKNYVLDRHSLKLLAEKIFNELNFDI